MKRFLNISVMYPIIITFLFSTQIYSQNDTEKLFSEARSLSKTALSVAANIFAENEFEKGNDFLAEAEKLLKSSATAQEIIQKLDSAIMMLKESLEKTKTMNTSFADIMKIRQLALNAEGNEAAPKLWKEGEDNFSSAVDDFNDKDMEGYQKSVKAAESNYKDAELAGIKGKYLNNLKASIAQAEEKETTKYAPITFQKSKKLAQDIETMLDANRYDTLKARTTMNKAVYELNHGLYLEDIFKKMKEKENTSEELVLLWEEPIIKIATAHKMEATFDKGYDGITSQLVSSITNDLETIDKITKENESLSKDLKDYKTKFADADNQNKQLISENASLKKALEEASKSNEEYKTKFAQLETENVKFKSQSDVMEKNTQLVDSVSSLFLPSEAEVLKSDDLIIIRLVNIAFPTNKSTLDPQYFNLLAKVKKALQIFPNGTSVIEGHTDGQGDYKKNLELSQQRANAVYQYLLANMGAEANKITTAGLGGSKPVANNASEEGRTKNRRIEIVINPHFASGK
jgi:OOP family OmpA-OmpF porin